MKYYKHIDSDGNAFQIEATTRKINSPSVVEISHQEYKELIASLPKEDEINALEEGEQHG